MSILEIPKNQESLSSLPNADMAYTMGLAEQYFQPEGQSLRIGENCYPSCLLTEQERKKSLNVTQYDEIKGRQDLEEVAKKIHLFVYGLNAGLGTSIRRGTYLKQIENETGVHQKLQPKATNLYFRDRDGSLVSIYEQRKNMLLSRTEQFAQITDKPVVNHESLDAVDKTIQAVREKYNKKGNITAGTYTFQHNIPTFNKEKKIFSWTDSGPGSHGQVLFSLLYEMMQSQIPLDQEEQEVFGVCNDDGPKNFFPPEMVALTKDAGFVILTTKRLRCDIKGGCISLKYPKNGPPVPTIMELAQAKAENQEELFLWLGVAHAQLPDHLKRLHHVGEQYFNTNNITGNKTLLHRFLIEGKKEIGEEAMARAMMPDVMTKIKNGNIIFEGAMASVILNLASSISQNKQLGNIWDSVSQGKQFVQFLNLSEQDRDLYFTPVKYGVDFWNLAHSGKFSLDHEGILQPNNGITHTAWEGDLVKNESYYMELQHVIDTMRNTDTSNLNEYCPTGKVDASNTILRGNIKISNMRTDEKPYPLNNPYVRGCLGQNGNDILICENISIQINPDGSISHKEEESLGK